MTIAPVTYLQVTSPYLKAELIKFSKAEHTDDTLEFLDSKATNQVLYNNYIKKGAPTQINLPDSLVRQFEPLAKVGKWSDMTRLVKTARANVNAMSIQFTTRFQDTEHGHRAVVMGRMGLTAAQAKIAEPLLQVYMKPHTPEDGYQAYLALAKLSSKAKAALTENGTPPPAKAPTGTQDQVNKNLAIDKLAKSMAVDVKECLRYLESAIKSVNKDGLPSDPVEVTRMFNSGRMRHDKVVLAWNKAIQSDRAFTSKYKTLAADKAKSDTLWATYTSKLNKR